MKCLKEIFTNRPLEIRTSAETTLSERSWSLLLELRERCGLRSIEIPNIQTTNPVKSPEEISVKITESSEQMEEELLQALCDYFIKHTEDSDNRILIDKNRMIGKATTFTQKKLGLFPQYLESFIIRSAERNQILRKGFGLLEIGLTEAENSFFSECHKSLSSGNLSYSQLKTSLNSKYKPLTVDFMKEFRPKQCIDWQKSVANAYWQTCWATGAIRGARGTTEPVLFFPIPWKSDRYIQQVSPQCFISSEPYRYYHQTQQEISKGNLYYNRTRELFVIQNQNEDVSDLENYLNDHCFCDLYTGSNKELSDEFQIKRSTSVIGSHLLTDVMKDYMQNQQFTHTLSDKPVLAAANSIFFLNFPEEYPAYYSSMNAPLGLLIQNNTILQPAIHKRGCFYQTSDSSAIEVFSLKNMVIDLYDFLTFESPENKTPGEWTYQSIYGDVKGYTNLISKGITPEDHDRIELVIIANQIIEIRTDGGQTQVPQNGFILAIPKEALSDLLELPTYEVGYRVQKGGLILDIENAFSCGPVLISKGMPINPDLFNLQTQQKDSALENFIGFQNKENVGLAPTRFPHFTDQVRAPRTFIGIDEASVYLTLVDGRSDTEHSIGMTLSEEAAFLKLLDCHSGLNLDGGGSSVMWLSEPHGSDFKIYEQASDGVVNRPSDMGGKERLLPVPILLFEE